MHDPLISTPELYGGLREERLIEADRPKDPPKLWPVEDPACALNRAQRRHPEKYGIPGPGLRGGKPRGRGW